MSGSVGRARSTRGHGRESARCTPTVSAIKLLPTCSTPRASRRCRGGVRWYVSTAQGPAGELPRRSPAPRNALSCPRYPDVVRVRRKRQTRVALRLDLRHSRRDQSSAALRRGPRGRAPSLESAQRPRARRSRRGPSHLDWQRISGAFHAAFVDTLGPALGSPKSNALPSSPDSPPPGRTWN